LSITAGGSGGSFEIGAGVGFPLAEAGATPATPPAIAENVSPSAKTKVPRGVSKPFPLSNDRLLDMLGGVRFPAKAVWMCQGSQADLTPRQSHIDKQDEKDIDRSRALASLRRDRFFGFAAARSSASASSTLCWPTSSTTASTRLR